MNKDENEVPTSAVVSWLLEMGVYREGVTDDVQREGLSRVVDTLVRSTTYIDKVLLEALWLAYEQNKRNNKALASLEAAETEVIVRALIAEKGNIVNACKRIDLSRSAFYYKVNKNGALAAVLKENPGVKGR
jgi:DNA-binding NtrC family response regulator